MKKSILSVAATLSLLAFANGAAAQSSTDWQNITLDRDAILARYCQRYPASRACTPVVREVPEIDASAGTQALALVLGVGLLSAESLRRRRRRRAIRSR